MALIIRADGTTEEVEIPRNDDGGYDVLSKAVGGLIEFVSFCQSPIVLGDEDGKPIGTFHGMYINEHGKILGLPKNKGADAIAHAISHISPTDEIVGDVILLTEDEIQ